MKEIEDKLSKNSSLKEKVSQAKQEAAQSKEKTQDTAPTVAGAFAINNSYSSYKLQNSWILDSGTDIHVCNDSARFKFERAAQEDDWIVSGKTTYEIEAFGTVDITAKGPDGPIILRLLNVALAPGFMSNLVSLRRMTEKGVH